MADLVVKRTLVKSPRLWNEVSDLERLARHLGELGEIRISRLDPERAVAWEGEHTRGTVEIEASGWETRVILTAEVEMRRSKPRCRGSRSQNADVEASAPDPDPDRSRPCPTRYPSPRSGRTLSRAEDAEPSRVDLTTAPAEGLASETPEGRSTERLPTEPRSRRAGFLARWLFRQRREEPVSTRRDLPAAGSYRAESEPGACPSRPCASAGGSVRARARARRPVAEPEPICLARTGRRGADSPPVAEPAPSVGPAHRSTASGCAWC